MVLTYGSGACDSLPCMCNNNMTVAKLTITNRACTVLDLDINDEVWQLVEESIRREMDSVVVAEDGMRPMHPRVDILLPLTVSNHCKPVLMEEIERYEREEEEASDISDDDDGDDVSGNTIIRDGIKYPTSFYNDKDEIDYDAIYTALSHSQLENRDLNLLAGTQTEIGICQDTYLAHLKELQGQLRALANRKRKETTELEYSRKKRQIEGYGPVETYLNQRWHDLIRSIVDMGAEMATKN